MPAARSIPGRGYPRDVHPCNALRVSPACGRGNPLGPAVLQRLWSPDRTAQPRDRRPLCAETVDLIQQCDMVGILSLVLLERAGLWGMRGDADGMARDLAEARRLFARMGATG